MEQAQIKRITQHCKDDKTRHSAPKPYNFKEKGWYHHTRAGALVGQAYYGENKQGVLFQHSSGWQFQRLLGIGLGLGIDYFDPKGNDAVTYPIFAELQGFLLPKNVTPFYNIGAGWAFTGRNSGEERWGKIDRWKGSWMAQAAIGYRIGRHFTVQTGIRLQHKRRVWTSVWGPESDFGEDRILHKRLIVAIGMTL